MTARTHAGTALLVLLAGTLTGCASGPSTFAQANNDREVSARESAPEFFEDVVIGTLYDDRGVPRYQSNVADLTNEEIADELRDMQALDEKLVRESTEFHTPTPGELARVEEIDRSHAARLAEIVETIGWPTRELVGADAAQGAFVVVQHAGHDPEFQSQCLALMVDEVERGTLPSAYVALLTDRIRMFAGQPQVFGTQMTFAQSSDGFARCAPATPIEDPANLDARRELMGLPPHDVFVSKLEEAYQAQHGGAFATVITDN
ncbi:MAG: DUF6624 domain-containing protein [Phycisphaerales bacterium]